MQNAAQTQNIVPISLPTPFPVGTTNVYLVKGDPLTLVDAGIKTEEAYRVLADQLASHGVALRDLEVILITHGHLDHVGLLGRLLEESQANAFAHPYVAEQLSQYEDSAKATCAFLRQIMGEFGVPPELIETCLAERETYQPYAEQVVIGHPIEDGAQIGPYRAYYVPGHSPSDTLFVDHRRRLAFTGDHILKRIHPNPLIRRPRPGQPRPKSLLEYRNSLLRTRSLDLDMAYPGHGPAFGDHRGVIDLLLRRQEDRASTILAMLDKAEVTPYQLSQRLFPSLEPGYLYLGLSAAVGFLELLEDRGQVQSYYREGALCFRTISSNGEPK